MRSRNVVVLAAIVATAVLAVPPAITADRAPDCTLPQVQDYMQIHMDNQRVGSAVSLYWHLQTAAWRLADTSN